MVLPSAVYDFGDEHFRIADNYLLKGTGAPPRIYPLIGRPLYLDSAHLTRSYAIRAATYIDATLDPSIVRKKGRAQ